MAVTLLPCRLLSPVTSRVVSAVTSIYCSSKFVSTFFKKIVWQRRLAVHAPAISPSVGWGNPPCSQGNVSIITQGRADQLTASITSLNKGLMYVCGNSLGENVGKVGVSHVTDADLKYVQKCTCIHKMRHSIVPVISHLYIVFQPALLPHPYIRGPPYILHACVSKRYYLL